MFCCVDSDCEDCRLWDMEIQGRVFLDCDTLIRAWPWYCTDDRFGGDGGMCCVTCRKSWAGKLGAAFAHFTQDPIRNFFFSRFCQNNTIAHELSVTF